MAGQPAHFEIPADDTAKGRQFWGSLFDWQFQASPGPFEYHMTRISDQAGAAITNMEPGKRGIRTYFYVDDINAGAARVKELGGEANEPGSCRAWAGSRPAPTLRGTSSACGRTTRPPQLQPGRPHQRQAASPTRAPPAIVSRRPWSCSPANAPGCWPAPGP
jgi:predicted enzyme related to lactoylglutathione lyase